MPSQVCLFLNSCIIHTPNEALFLIRSWLHFQSNWPSCRISHCVWFIQVDDLMEASKTYDTLESIIDFDVANDTVKSPGSHSRNLRRVRQGLDLIRALFEQFLSTEYVQPPYV